MKLYHVLSCAVLVTLSTTAWVVGADTYSGVMLPTYADLSPGISSVDALNGKVGIIDFGGFHPSIPNDQAKFTDGQLGSNVDCVLWDYMAPTLIVRYEDTEGNWTPTPVANILSFAGNGSKDGRVFQNIQMKWKDASGNWIDVLGGSQLTTAPFHTSNSGNEASLINVYNDAGGALFGGATVHGLTLTYWAVDNTQNWFLPPSENPVAATILKEIDVIAIPEPTSLVLLVLAGLLLRRRA